VKSAPVLRLSQERDDGLCSLLPAEHGDYGASIEHERQVSGQSAAPRSRFPPPSGERSPRSARRDPCQYRPHGADGPFALRVRDPGTGAPQPTRRQGSRTAPWRLRTLRRLLPHRLPVARP